jgi:capsular polysaccharide biosynthesis protein
VEIIGQDGIITQSKRGNKKCEMFLPSAGIYHNLPRNVPMKMVWLNNNDQNIPDHAIPPHDYTKGKSRNFARSMTRSQIMLERAASVVQYASMSYYHWVTEGLGRFLLLLPFLKKHSEMYLILPNSPTGHENHFIVQYVRIVAPFMFNPVNTTSRIIWYNSESLVPIDTRLRVKKLYYANWNPMTSISHCLVPGNVLRLIRSSFVKSFSSSVIVDKRSKTTKQLVIFCVRNNVSMRKFRDSTGLLEGLEELLSESSSHSFIRFEGNQDVREQIDMFSRAAIVVGVHGGSLANIVFCAPETVVFEIGFHTPQTDHYAHTSRELNLEYHRVDALADGDVSSVSSEFVYIDKSSSNEILKRVAEKINYVGHVDEF